MATLPNALVDSPAPCFVLTPSRDGAGRLVDWMCTALNGAARAFAHTCEYDKAVVNATVNQYNPVTRDPIQQLRSDAESVIAGIWS